MAHLDELSIKLNNIVPNITAQEKDALLRFIAGLLLNQSMDLKIQSRLYLTETPKS